MMTTPLNIDADDILKLDDVELRELVARLSEAEVLAAKHSASAVTWGGHQNAPDGGIDVRVSLPDGVQISGFVPCAETGYQAKAEDFARADITKEMEPKGKLRQSIVDLSDQGGAYIIVSSKGSLADPALADRKRAMQDCIRRFSPASTLTVDFYDRRRLATWVEQHPTIAVWVREKVGRPMAGWQPYAAWAFGEDELGSEYVLDEAAKVFAPNEDEGISIEAAISRLRSELATPQKSVRLTGLSGVGKTRLVQALFDLTVEADSVALDPNAVLYTDMSDKPDPAPQQVVDTLLARNDRVLVIVDNCGADLHQRLTEKVKHKNSSLRLLTIEYDIRDDNPEGTICYRLEPSSDELIKTIIKRRHPTLTTLDIDTIANFSGGNARVAFALANTSSNGGELARLEDEQLFLRLFHQAHEPNNELLVAAETCSLLYSFNGEELSGDQAELATLAELADQSVITLSRNVEELRRRSLVQSRGPWRAVLPHAIANRLAQRALQNAPTPVLLARFVDDASDRVAKSFSRRIGYLHEELKAKTIASDWFAPDGRLGDIANLNELGRDMFSNIAPIDPSSTLDVIERALDNPEFLSTRNYDRAFYIRIARATAYDAELFHKAVRCIAAFARVEPQGYNRDAAQDAIASLFQIHLSGTSATPQMRADLVGSMLAAPELEQQKLGLCCLEAALEASHFSATYDPEFGARKRGYGWRPKLVRDVSLWFGLFLSIAQNFGEARTPIGNRIRSMVGHKFPGLWKHGAVLDEMERIAATFHHSGGWPEGWRATKLTLKYNRTKMPTDVLARLVALEEKLRPVDLVGSVRGHVFGDGLSVVDVDDDEETSGVESYERAQAKSKELGRLVAVDDDAFATLLPEVMRENTMFVMAFGAGVGELLPLSDSIVEKLRSLFAEIPNKELSVAFVMSFLGAAHRQDESAVETFLDMALEDGIFAPYFPLLQCGVELNDAGVARLHRALELGHAPVHRYQTLASGRATDPLTIREVASLVTAISIRDGGQVVAIDILAMVVHCSGNKETEYKDELKNFCGTFLSQPFSLPSDHLNDHLNYEIRQLIKYAVVGQGRETVAVDIYRALEENKDDTRLFRQDRNLEPLLKHQPIAMLDEIFVPDQNGSYVDAQNKLSTNWSRDAAAIDHAPVSAVMEWCSVEPNTRVPFIASCHNPFSDAEKPPYEWQELALELLRQASDKSEVLELIVDHVFPTGWSGSRAAIIRQRAELFDQLPSLVDGVTEEHVRPIKQRLDEVVESDEQHEAENDRIRDERFE